MSGDVLAVFIAVVGARFLLPLFIPRYPLPAIIACLVLDGVDQTIFQAFGYDPPGYQGYDKAMDIYYLAIAYLATMRNWGKLPRSGSAGSCTSTGSSGWSPSSCSQVRALLLIFPNTFEYFFIAYEAVRSRWSTLRFSLRWWLTAAALIWVVVKLPQEYWIHIAQLDVTDILTENAWAPPLLVAILLALAAVFWFLVRPRLLPPDWDWRLAADPMPEEMDTAAEQSRLARPVGRVRSWATLEKVVLVGLIAVVYGEILPDVRSTTLRDVPRCRRRDRRERRVHGGAGAAVLVDHIDGPGVPRPAGRQRRAGVRGQDWLFDRGAPATSTPAPRSSSCR